MAHGIFKDSTHFRNVENFCYPLYRVRESEQLHQNLYAWRAEIDTRVKADLLDKLDVLSGLDKEDWVRVMPVIARQIRSDAAHYPSGAMAEDFRLDITAHVLRENSQDMFHRIRDLFTERKQLESADNIKSDVVLLEKLWRTGTEVIPITPNAPAVMVVENNGQYVVLTGSKDGDHLKIDSHYQSQSLDIANYIARQQKKW